MQRSADGSILVSVPAHLVSIIWFTNRSTGRAVVFGRVAEGMPVVRSIEAMGSSSGKTRQRVAIAECGELPSRRQILAKMAVEKEALANMKKDPLQA